MANPNLYIKQMEIGPMQNFVYFVGDSQTREVAVVDAAWNVPQILQAAAEEDLTITHAFVSHYHYDHTNGLPDLLNELDVPVYVNKEEAVWMKDLAAENTKAVSSGDKVKIGSVEVEFIHTPGHTPGSHCFLVDNNLVAGDTLFIDACGRTDLPGGDPEQLFDSLTNKLMKLDDATILYPGHDYAAVTTATLGEQKQTNPFLRIGTLDEFLKTLKYK